MAAEKSVAELPQQNTASTGKTNASIQEEREAAWRALSEEKQAALKEREAVRLFALGLQKQDASAFDEAVDAYSRALALNPAFAEAYGNMGVSLRALGKTEAAVASHRRAIALSPKNPGLHLNLGNAQRDLGQLDLAEAAYRQAAHLATDKPDGFYNVGIIRRDKGDAKGALKAFAKALEIMPDHAPSRVERARTLLMTGNFTKGFEELEARFQLPGYQRRRFEKPLWDGAPLRGRTVLVIAEQGLSDIVHFARYLPHIKEHGGNIVVQVPKTLAGLIGTVRGVDKVVLSGAGLPRFDLYLPMMSLARLFPPPAGEAPTASIPYLRPPDPGVIHLPPTPGSLKVGLNWGEDEGRNLPRASEPPGLARLLELTGVPGATFFSLQRGPSADEFKTAGCGALITDTAKHFRDLGDAAAVIDQLDLVITSDSVIAHVAGALDKPVWLAAPSAPDWRWGIAGDKSACYPSMRLFRCPNPAAWPLVIEQIRQALVVFRGEHAAKG